MKEIYLTPEQYYAYRCIPKDADYTQYIFWLGIFALNGLRHNFHNTYDLPTYQGRGIFTYNE